MKASIWYRVDEKLPDKPGHYLTFIGPSLSGHGGIATCYFVATDIGWRERIAAHSPEANVVYWSDADPWKWLCHEPQFKKTAAMEKAWARVEDAISKYEMIEILSYGNEHS